MNQQRVLDVLLNDELGAFDHFGRRLDIPVLFVHLVWLITPRFDGGVIIVIVLCVN